MLTLTELQKHALKVSELSVDALEVLWRLFPEYSFEAACGSLSMLLKGQGQFRNERFSPLTEGISEDFKAASMEDGKMPEMPVGFTDKESKSE